MGRWRMTSEATSDTTLLMRVEHDGAPLTMHRGLALLETDEAFRSDLVRQLRAAPWEAFFWETPPTSQSHPGRFEHVLTHAPGLERASADRAAFDEHFAECDEPVAVFDNLGGDATLVVPTPLGDDDGYVHLGRFLQTAIDPQIHMFFATIGRVARAHLSSRPLWLSTAGMGVYWLHARIDSRPKYYRHQPYRVPP